MAEESDTRRPRRRLHTGSELISALPDHVAQLILHRLPPSLLFSVCRSWRRLLYSPSFPSPSFSCLYALLFPASALGGGCADGDGETVLHLSAFDPLSSRWGHLPSPPVRLLLSHPSILCHRLPVQSLSSRQRLLLISATTDRLHLRPALDRPLVFLPESRAWTPGPPFTSPRRWCACGSAGGSVYLASGVSAEFSQHVARSLEKWDVDSPDRKPRWERRAPLPNSKFCRDTIEAVGWRAKLWIVNIKGGRHREGLVYDAGSDRWEAMPMGMLAGWTGPVASDDTDDSGSGPIYCADEHQGTLKVYDETADTWRVVVESEHLRGATQMAAKSGKVCVVSRGGGSISVVDTVSRPVRVCVVDPPAGFGVVAVHILPRPA
ncbi:F-box/kelch-repeat protein SKIP25 [Nymphaea colorata]|nr:F-box/kelch-repeat protein SKIP25 [Nymphaea colorata]